MARKKRATSANRLLDHIDGLLQKLRDQTPLALQTFDAGAVHAARVSTRRLSAILELMSPVLGKSDRKPLLRGLKRLRKRLGRLRDSDILMERANELPDDPELARPGEWVRDRLEQSRRKLHERSLKKSPAQKALRPIEGWQEIRQQIEEADEAIGCLLAESLHLQTDAFVEQAGRLAASRQQTSPATPDPTDTTDAAADPPSEEQIHRPHQVRIAGKNLRYTLEIAEACGRPLGAAVMRVFKKMQDQLGAWHDWVVLADCTLREMVDEELTMDAEAAEAALKLVRRCLRRSARELDRFARTWREQGPAVVEKIRSTFPLSMEIPVAATVQDAAPAQEMPLESENAPVAQPEFHDRPVPPDVPV